LTWLVDDCEETQLFNNKTKLLAFAYVDKYLSKNPIPIKYLQLLGATALLLAAKVEENFLYKIKQVLNSSGD